MAQRCHHQHKKYFPLTSSDYKRFTSLQVEPELQNFSKLVVKRIKHKQRVLRKMIFVSYHQINKSAALTIKSFKSTQPS